VSFAALFGRSPPVTADAPGRVNLIGEHTDYNQGFVLPMPIPQRTVAELAPRADEQVRAASASLTGEVEQYALGAETPGRGWLDYVQGLTWALRADGALILGFDLRLASSVPIGAGLASSAALEVAVLLARRVRHVVGENERVLAAVAALEAGDLVRLGALLDASHASLRDDYEVSTPEVDQLVEVARAQPETLGARLTGGGFGGAIVALVRRGGAAAVARLDADGRRGPVLVGVVPVVVLEDLPGVLPAGEEVDRDPRAALVLVRRELDHVHGERRDPLRGAGGRAERRDVDVVVAERQLLCMMADGARPGSGDVEDDLGGERVGGGAVDVVRGQDDRLVRRQAQSDAGREARHLVR